MRVEIARDVMASIIRFLTVAGLLVGSLSITLFAQTSTVIPDTEAEKHIGQDVTVEGVVTAVTTSRKGNTFINFGGVYPNQTFTGWIPAGTPLANDASIPALQGKKTRSPARSSFTTGSLRPKSHRKDQIVSE
jgi:hypothetical protein